MFFEKIWLTIPKLSLLPLLIWSTGITITGKTLLKKCYPFQQAVKKENKKKQELLLLKVYPFTLGEWVHFQGKQLLLNVYLPRPSSVKSTFTMKNMNPLAPFC